MWIIEAQSASADATLILTKFGTWKRWDNIDLKMEAQFFNSLDDAHEMATKKQHSVPTRKIVAVNTKP